MAGFLLPLAGEIELPRSRYPATQIKRSTTKPRLFDALFVLFERTDGKEVADGLEPAWGASAVADPDPKLNEQWEKTFRRWYPAFRPRAASRVTA